jgi:glycosyltransferase involved in cell wall biosynthesis
VRDAGLADRVTFHGFLDQDALVPLYRRAHLYVQTSWHEGAGVSVLEAASAHVPVVGTRVGYVADWAPQAAVAVDRPSPDALAAAFEALLVDPEQRRQLAAHASRRVQREDVRAAAARFEAIYQSIGRSAAAPTSAVHGR